MGVRSNVWKGEGVLKKREYDWRGRNRWWKLGHGKQNYGGRGNKGLTKGEASVEE